MQEFNGCLLDLTGEELRVGAVAAAGAVGHATAPQAANDPALASLKAECESLRLEIRELWRRVRGLEDVYGAIEHNVAFLERVAVTAQRRYRILR